MVAMTTTDALERSDRSYDPGSVTMARYFGPVVQR
jgi:hypothetical protein